MSKEMEKISEELRETKAPDTAEAQEMSDDDLDEVSGGIFRASSKIKTDDLVYRTGSVSTSSSSKKKTTTGSVKVTKL